MTDPQQIIDTYKELTGEILRVACGYIGITFLVLTILTFYKKYQRETLWIVGIAIILIVMALNVFGVLDIYNLRDRLIMILGVVCAGLYAYTAEKLYKSIKSKAEKEIAPSTSQVIPTIENTTLSQDSSPRETQEEIATEFVPDMTEQNVDDKKVTIPPRLATDIAIRVFGRAKLDGFITEMDGHYKWNGKKVLLAYMCGRIYCEDKSEYEKATGINKWKQGKLTFPETALNELFNETALGQSRRSRELSACPDGFRKIDSYFV